MTSYQIRRLKSKGMVALLAAASIIALVPLFAILWLVIEKGFKGLSLQFFTELPKPVGEVGGGLGNAVLGTLWMVTSAGLMGLPFGIGTGVYLSEFPRSRAAFLIRMSVELLASVPSIVLGIFAYALLVVPMKGFSALAGSLALSVIFIPTVAKTTEEVLKLVPASVREAGLALGLPRWKVILRIVLWGSRSGVLTGVMLATARIAGESAPLLFTALNSQYWPKGLLQPISSLPIQIYTYAISPFEEWTQLAWTGAFVLVFLVFITNLLMRFLIRRGQ